MKKFSRRDFIKASIAIVGAQTLAACAGSPSTPAQSGAAPAGAPTTAASGAAPAATSSTASSQQVSGSVRFFAYRVSEPLPGEKIKQQVQKFSDSHPNIKVTIESAPTAEAQQRITTQMAAGDGPDVTEFGNEYIPAFYKNNFLADHQKFIDAEGGSKFTQIYDKKFVDWLSKDGKVLGMPVWTNTLLLTYNAGWFKEAGLDPAVPPTTWDDFTAYGKKLTRDKGGTGKVNQWGVGIYGMRHEIAARYLHSFYWQNGAAIYNDNMTKSTINSEKGTETFLWYTGLNNDLGLVPPNFMTNAMQDIYKDWCNQIVNMFMVGPWLRAFVRSTNKDMETNLRAAPVPYKSAQGTVGSTGIGSYGLTTQARNQAAAWELVKYMTNRENLLEYCLYCDYLPPIAGAADSKEYQSDPWMLPFAKVLPDVKLIPIHPRKADLDLVIADALQSVWLKKKSAKQAVDDAAKDLDAILAQG